ncbi:Sigma-70 factor, region 1.2 [Mycobacteroides abscessus subsp. abscessus]|uniref:Sigma-70 factor, region 1.2 n=2 Tax=Mycobacteroides abscessus TaxID=36809 RepID=A0A0U1BJ69_9MYCO|nr:sigma-70 factor domain-containing protein [Mycobacteroides abscessus]MBN7344716.1 hypothetical protein [Mycobacteroides abscessus subsp. massiliense]MBN7397528.1 hypothetical protein [Mycobacteroides abscessus subsp. abscessus]MBN7532273.1 hypothetical protein [Mycobacteroides abscessus subsp. abscessus]MBN7541405.1 hypothetical protein [Mycobacteroides abscessus subsp. massiliense]NOS10539.1 hypothetical protein [Mycobacteroides abscessus]
MHLVKQIEILEDLPDLLTAEQEVELAKRIEAGVTGPAASRSSEPTISMRKLSDDY